MKDVRTYFILPAFIVGWIKSWNLTTEQQEAIYNTIISDIVDLDIFKLVVIRNVEGLTQEKNNAELAGSFGEIVTKVKTFPTKDGTWIILDKYTERLLHRDIKNENEVNLLCRKHNYLR